MIDTAGPAPATPPDAVRLVIGVVIGTHGLNGELKVRPHTDRPEQFAELRACYFGDESLPRRVRFTRFHAQQVLVTVNGVRTPEEAAAFKGMSLRVSANDLRPLAPGEYFLYQLIGLEAKTEQGEVIGQVVDLMETGAADVFVIRPASGGAPVLLANIPENVIAIDPVAGDMIVHLPEYLD